MSNDIQRLKALDLFLMYQDTLPEEDIQYAFDCLRSTNKKTITLAAFIISELDTSHLQRLFDHFHSYSQFTQHTLVSHLVTIPTKAPYLFLFNLLESFLLNKIEDLHKQNIKLKILGSKKFSLKLNKLLNESEKKTSKNTKLQINLALNYGSKSELINAFKKVHKNNKRINEKNLVKNLQTKDIPDPDLLIRTGNTKRLSNFLLWQLAYSEIFFEKKLWPDFNEKDYNNIIKNYKKIKRNFGKI